MLMFIHLKTLIQLIYDMKNQVILHIKYQLSKYNFIIFSIMFIIYIVLALMASKFYLSSNEQLLYKEEIMQSYSYLMLAIEKLMIILISTYVFSNLSSNSLLLLLKSDKLTFFVSKTISNIILVLAFNMVFILIYQIVPMIFSKWYNFQIIFFEDVITLSIKSIVIGLIAQFVAYIFKGKFSFILVYFIFLILENVSHETILFQILNSVFPVVINKNFGFLQLLVQFILYTILGFWRFLKYENY